MKKIQIPTKSIILTILAFACVVWSQFQYSVYKQGAYLTETEIVSDLAEADEGKIVGITGKVTENDLPKDTMTGIYAECLALERKVEMYQYVVEDDKVYMQYSSEAEGDITGIGGEQYTNPKFPNDLESAMFFGTGKLEGTDIVVGPRILKEYTGKDSHNLKGNLAVFENKYNLTPNGEGGYSNCAGDKPQIGDIRIVYYAWVSSDFDDVVIIGSVKDGTIGSETDTGICTVDFEAASPEDIYQNNFSEYKNNAKGLLFAAVVLVVIAIIALLLKNKNRFSFKTSSVCLILPLILIAMSIPGNADFGDYGGDYDYGGYDSYDYDYDYDDNDYDYDYDYGNNDYHYGSYTPAEPKTTRYYSVGYTEARKMKMYNFEGNEIDPEPITKIGPDFSGGENSVLGFIAAAIIICIVIAVVRKNKGGGSPSNFNGGNTGNNRPYIPGAEKTSASELTDISEYSKLDPEFSPSEFKEKVSNLYIRLQNAWQRKNLEEIRPYLSDAFYSQSDSQLDRYRRNKQTNVIEKIAVLDVNISGYKQERGKDIVVALVQTRITDYVIDDDTREVVSGSSTAEKFMTYEWHMERTTGVTTKSISGLSAQNCPNCGAPVNINHSAKCEYCGSILTTDTFDWTLCKIKGISQRTVGK